MISLDPKKYLNKYCLVIRVWDGIDQPDFTPVLDITEEEMGWKGGRFKNCVSRYFKEGEAINLYLRVENPVKELKPLIDWVAENIHGEWSVDIESAIVSECWKFSFIEQSDASLFRLTWNAATHKFDLFK